MLYILRILKTSGFWNYQIKSCDLKKLTAGMHRLCLWSTVNGPHILLTHGMLDETGMAIVTP
jgi:hypothetical protein